MILFMLVADRDPSVLSAHHKTEATVSGCKEQNLDRRSVAVGLFQYVSSTIINELPHEPSHAV